MNISEEEIWKIRRAYEGFEPTYQSVVATIRSSRIDEQQEVIDWIKGFGKHAFPNEPIVLLIDNRTASVIYISDSVSQLGYSAKDIYGMNSMYMFLGIHSSHWAFPVTALKWDVEFIRHAPNDLLRERYVNYYVGLKLNVKGGKPIRTFFQATNTFKKNKLTFPCLTLCVFQNIDHLLREDFYWGRYVCGDTGEQHTRFYQSSIWKRQQNDMITEREKDILSLIEKNLTSKEISDTLNISLNTVETHRRNMLQRLGARDTTALVQLCKLCEALP